MNTRGQARLNRRAEAVEKLSPEGRRLLDGCWCLEDGGISKMDVAGVCGGD